MAYRTNTPKSESKPYKLVYGIVQRDGMEKSFWTRIGAAWENKDSSLNVKLDFLPASADITLQIRDPRPSEDGE
jgi:hypothetical protein